MARNKPIREYKVAGKQYAYLLDECIDLSNYGGATDDRTKIYVVLAEYKNYLKNNAKPKTWSTGKHIGDWLRGLPSCCTVEYGDYEIVQIGRKWGFPLRNEPAQEKFVDDWWTMCGQRLLEIADKLNVSFNKVLPYDHKRTIQKQMQAAGV